MVAWCKATLVHQRVITHSAMTECITLVGVKGTASKFNYGKGARSAPMHVYTYT